MCIYHASTRVNLKDFVKAWLNRVSGGMTAKIGLQKAKKKQKGQIRRATPRTNRIVTPKQQDHQA